MLKRVQSRQDKKKKKRSSILLSCSKLSAITSDLPLYPERRFARFRSCIWLLQLFLICVCFDVKEARKREFFVRERFFEENQISEESEVCL